MIKKGCREVAFFTSNNFVDLCKQNTKKMIRLNEIRVGNLVFDEEKKQTQVHVIHADSMWLNAKQISYYTPIPITEEWIVKFGFELYDYEPNEEGDEFPDFIYMSYKLTIPKKAYYYTITTTPEEGGYFDFCIKVTFADYVMLSTIQYVHQLQNLYFALTGEELQLNTTPCNNAQP